MGLSKNLKEIDQTNAIHLSLWTRGFTSIEYIVHSSLMVVFTGMFDIGMIKKMLSQFLQLEEDRFIVGFHQQVKKERQKDWHHRHTKNK